LAGIGGQAHVFGSQKGVEAGLNKITAALAVAWFLVAIALASMGRSGV
jgi:protein translocase SecG subunit